MNGPNTNGQESTDQIYAELFRQNELHAIAYTLPGVFLIEINGIDARLNLPHEDRLEKILAKPLETRTKDIKTSLEIRPKGGCMMSSPPEDIIISQKNLMTARDFLQKKCYSLKLKWGYNCSPAFYIINLNEIISCESERISEVLRDIKSLEEHMQNEAKK